MASRLARWGAVAAVGSVLILIPVAVLARPYFGSLFGFSCADRAPSLTDLRSVDELRTRFEADAGSPRLVLLVSPT